MKRVIILLFAAMGSVGVSAQVVHEFSINGGVGLSALNYKLSAGKKNLGFGGDCGLGYSYFFKEQWGFGTGVDFGFYNAKAKLDNVQVITSGLQDSENDRFDMYSTLKNYTEKQKAIFLNIPLMLQFQTKGIQKFYANAGVKIGFPLSSKFRVSDAEITNKGYYPDYDNWLEMPAFACFGTFSDYNSTGKLKLGLTAMLTLEVGGKWKLSEKVTLYTGIYFDYGLNNSLKDKDQPFVNYSNSHPAEFTTNSALPSLTDKINPMAVGLKLRLALVKITENGE